MYQGPYGGLGSPQDQSTTVFLANGQLPAAQRLQFADSQQRIRGLTVQNNSTCPVNVYFNRAPQRSSDPADVAVAAASTNNIPVAGANYITITFSAAANGAVPSGSVYLHWTTDLVASSSSAISISAGSSGFSVNGYTTFASGIVLQWGEQNVTGHDTTFTLTMPTNFGTAIYSYVLYVQRFDGTTELISAVVTGFQLTPTQLFCKLIGGLSVQTYIVSFQVIGI